MGDSTWATLLVAAPCRQEATLQSAAAVVQALVPNAQRIFQLLAEEQLEADAQGDVTHTMHISSDCSTPVVYPCRLVCPGQHAVGRQIIGSLCHATSAAPQDACGVPLQLRVLRPF